MTENTQNGIANQHAAGEAPAEMRIRVGPLMFQEMKARATDGEKLSWNHLEEALKELKSENARIKKNPDMATPAPATNPDQDYTHQLIERLTAKFDGAIDGMGDEVLELIRAGHSAQMDTLTSIESAVNGMRYMFGVLAASSEDQDVRKCIELANDRLDEILKPLRVPNETGKENEGQDLDEDVKQSARAMRSQEGGDGRSTDPQDKERER